MCTKLRSLSPLTVPVALMYALMFFAHPIAHAWGPITRSWSRSLPARLMRMTTGVGLSGAAVTTCTLAAYPLYTLEKAAHKIAQDYKKVLDAQTILSEEKLHAEEEMRRMGYHKDLEKRPMIKQNLNERLSNEGRGALIRTALKKEKELLIAQNVETPEGQPQSINDEQRKTNADKINKIDAFIKLSLDYEAAYNSLQKYNIHTMFFFLGTLFSWINVYHTMVNHSWERHQTMSQMWSDIVKIALKPAARRVLATTLVTALFHYKFLKPVLEQDSLKELLKVPRAEGQAS